MSPRRVAPLALLSAGLLLFGLQPADAAGSAARQPVPAKISSGLKILVTAQAQGRPLDSQTTADASASVGAVSGARVDAAGRAMVNVYVNGSVPAAAADLAGLGMKVTATSEVEPERVVSGWLPVSRLMDASALASVKAVLAGHTGMDGIGGGDTGSVLSQGDAAHHGPQARALGTTGAGVKVGVISDSIDRVSGGVAASQATGNLPAGVHVLKDDTQPGTIDEGRAMAEIIYDEAPGLTDLYFASGTIGTATDKADSINQLVAAGVKVIADDIFLLDEPMFQDGVVAQAVDAAKAANVNYFSSAGNRARQSWEGTMTAGADNDFDTTAATDTIQSIGTFASSSPYVSLQWAEPWGAATDDFSIKWYLDGSTTPVATTNDNNLVNGIPNEFGQISFSGSHAVAIGIHREAGAGTPKLKWIAGGKTVNSIEYATNSNAINPDAASAAGSIAVAAASWSTPTTPESYSSRGPNITRYFDKLGVPLVTPVVRTKPALTAADGVATTVPALLSFSGTSAATPSAAGIAMLLRSAAPALTESQVATIMTNPANAQACATAQPATDCGSGFVMADLVIASLDSTPPVVTGAVSPAAPNGANGWYKSAPTVTWTVTDPQSATTTTGCTSPLVVTAEGTSNLTCSATSVGGTAQASLTFKLDASGPTGVAFQGIKKTYKHGKKPKKNKITCSASDSVSGVASCVISGFSKKKGKHTLTATATNGAGLTSTATFTYTIKK